MSKIIFLLLHLTFAFATIDDDQVWMDWKAKYYKNKLFASEQKEMKAYLNFKTNEQKVLMHNANPERSYDQGLNKFSIYTEVDLEKFLGIRKPKNSVHVRSEVSCVGPLGNYTSESKNLPKFVNFTKFYQPIQDQGKCGSCWSFAVGAGIENFIKNRNKNFSRTISQSFFVDCDTAVNEGCDGGWHYDAALFARDFDNNQAPDNKDYPYKYPTDGSNRFPCKNITKNLIKLDIVNPIFPGKLSLKDLQACVANNGHAVVAIHASGRFANYKKGIFKDSLCYTGQDRVNHAIVIVGYDSVKKYWIIRNSWGSSWGERGYMRMAFGICNIELYPLIFA